MPTITKLSELKFSYKTSLKLVENPIKIQIQINEKAISKTIPSRVFKGFDTYDELTTFVRNNDNYSIHEVTRCNTDSIQRIFLDIDAEYKKYPNKTELTRVYELLLKTVKYMLIDIDLMNPDYYELTSHTDEKFSSHIVYKHAYINALHYECFYKSLIENFAFDLDVNSLNADYINIIDKDVYITNHCLRVHTSHKFGKSTKLKLTNEPNEQFDPKTLVQYIYTGVETTNNSIKIYICNPEQHTAENKERITEITDDNMRIASLVIENLAEYGISERKINGNFINLYVDHSKPCYVCGNKHDSENMMAVVSSANVKLICRRQQTTSANRYKIIHEFAKYIEDKNEPINNSIVTKSDYLPSIIKTIIKFAELYLRSDLGSGKSTRIYKFIAKQLRKNPGYRCIFLTYRISLAAKILNDTIKQISDTDIKFQKYNDITGYTISLKNNKLLIVQLESLARIDYDLDNNETLDLIVIDEAVSFAQQNLSGLNESKIYVNRAMLENLLNSAKQVIISDALLDSATIQAYEVLRPSINKIIWVNEPLTQWKPVVTKYDKLGPFRRSLVSDIRSGLKIFVTATRGEKWIRQLERYLLGKAHDRQILTIYGGGPNNEHIIANINTEFTEYDIVIASPCMSAGVSFDVKNYFDKIYAYVESKGPTAIDVIQSLKRVRHTKTNEIVICDMTRNINLPTSINDIFEYEERNLKFNSIDYVNNGFSTKMIGKKTYFRHPDDQLLQWVFHCKRIVNLNSIHLFDTVIDYLKSKGAIVSDAKCEDDDLNIIEADNEEFNNQVKATKSEMELDIALAPVLSYDDYHALTRNRIRINSDDAPAIKKYELLRHYGFEHNIVNSDAKNKRMRSFNNPDFIKLYSKQNVMKSYKTAIYRQLSDETIRQIDDYHTRFMDDEEKTRHNYLFGRHVTINKILSIIPAGGTEYEPVLQIMKQLHEEGNHLLAGWKIPNKLNMINMVNSVIQEYCYKLHSKQVRRGTKINRILYIEDTLPVLFDVHEIKYPGDDFSISVIRQSGESPVPTICIYTE